MELQQKVSRQIGQSGYYISPLGEVFSCKSGEMKVMVTCLNKGGYETISLVIDGIRKNYHPHRLVAEYFLDKIDGKEYVNHKDGIKTNNHVDNLEWVTAGENQRHAYIIGAKRRMSGVSHWRSKKIFQYNNEGTLIASHDGLRQAHKSTGVSLAGISFAINGIRKSAGGFIWSKV